MDRLFIRLGAVAGFVGVALGAFGAHALRTRLSAERLAVFETGVRWLESLRLRVGFASWPVGPAWRWVRSVPELARLLQRFSL